MQDEPRDDSRERMHERMRSLDVIAESFAIGLAAPSVDFTLLSHRCAPETFTRFEEAEAFLHRHRVNVGGTLAPMPIFTFEEAMFPVDIDETLARLGWTQPTVIQAVALPIVLAGRDLVGIAETGSGKTAAFAIPAILHCSLNKEQHRNGPHALILCATHELACQHYELLVQLARPRDLKLACLYGGDNRRNQVDAVRRGCDLIVATPGRVLDFLSSEILDLTPVSFVVIDETDRMLEKNPELQVRGILKRCQTDRQTLMWSATMTGNVQWLAEELLKIDRMTVVVGKVNRRITQHFVYLEHEDDRHPAFLSTLRDIQKEMKLDMKVIVFLNACQEAEQLAKHPSLHTLNIRVIHGKLDQGQRDYVYQWFKAAKCKILVASDVAARGLDFPDVTHVVNYQMPDTIDLYLNRIGRTARGRKTGVSISFMTEKERFMSRKLVKQLRLGKQEVPAWLLEMADQTPKGAYKEHCPLAKRFREFVV
jgi:superfamily II DNA/RNA helicase